MLNWTPLSSLEKGKWTGNLFFKSHTIDPNYCRVWDKIFLRIGFHVIANNKIYINNVFLIDIQCKWTHAKLQFDYSSGWELECTGNGFYLLNGVLGKVLWNSNLSSTMRHLKKMDFGFTPLKNSHEWISVLKSKYQMFLVRQRIFRNCFPKKTVRYS